MYNGPPKTSTITLRYLETVETNWEVFDDPLAAYLAVRQPIERGYPKVAHLAGVRGTSVTERRFEGHCRALEEFGHSCDPPLVFWGNRTISDGYETFRKLVARQRPPLAVFCLNDLASSACCGRLRNWGWGCLTTSGSLGTTISNGLPAQASLSRLSQAHTMFWEKPPGSCSTSCLARRARGASRCPETRTGGPRIMPGGKMGLDEGRQDCTPCYYGGTDCTRTRLGGWL